MPDEEPSPPSEAELDGVMNAPSRRSKGEIELVALPRGLRQRLVAEVRYWREWGRRLGYHPPGHAKMIIPCPVCGSEYEHVMVKPIPLEERRAGQPVDFVEYVHQNGTRCRGEADPPA